MHVARRPHHDRFEVEQITGFQCAKQELQLIRYNVQQPVCYFVSADAQILRVLMLDEQAT